MYVLVTVQVGIGVIQQLREQDLRCFWPLPLAVHVY